MRGERKQLMRTFFTVCLCIRVGDLLPAAGLTRADHADATLLSRSDSADALTHSHTHGDYQQRLSLTTGKMDECLMRE